MEFTVSLLPVSIPIAAWLSWKKVMSSRKSISSQLLPLTITTKLPDHSIQISRRFYQSVVIAPVRSSYCGRDKRQRQACDYNVSPISLTPGFSRVRNSTAFGARRHLDETVETAGP